METTEKFYIGIDIGSKGGVAVLRKDGTVEALFKMPEKENVPAWRLKFAKYENAHCFGITEKVGPHPMNGAKGNFGFGESRMWVITMLQVSGISFQEVATNMWPREFGMTKLPNEKKGDWKRRLKALAQQMFPKEKVIEDVADALLLAEYCRRKYP